MDDNFPIGKGLCKALTLNGSGWNDKKIDMGIGLENFSSMVFGEGWG